MGLLELLGVALAAVVGAFFYGKRKGKSVADEQRRLSDLEASKKAHDTRRRIEDEIDEDVDLYTRAVNAGLVQGGGK